jgi:hypothetical protein
MLVEKISTEYSRLGVHEAFWGIFTRNSNHPNQSLMNNQQLHHYQPQKLIGFPDSG